MKDEIKNAPEFDEKTYRGERYRNELSEYDGRRGDAERIERARD